MSKITIGNYNHFKKISIVFLGLILLLGPSVQSAYAVSFSFSSEINLSDDTASNTIPQIVASGNDIYVVFKKSTSSEVFFTNSTDGGANFDSAVNLSNGGTASNNPQISVSGNNIYVVWQEGTDVVVGQSTDNGDTPPSSTTTLSSGSANSPQIEASGSNVYVAFRDGADVILSTSINSGSSYSSNNLSNSADSSSLPQLATTGSDTYVVWKELNDINLVKVSNNGATVGSVQSISGSGAGTVSTKPQVAASGSNVYVIWMEGSDIFVRTSNNGATSFGTATDIGDTGGTGSSNPKIVVVGSNAFAVWRENVSGSGDTMFSRSISGGAFSTPDNLSSNTGSSIKPAIAASGSNVYVAWRDNTAGTTDMLFRGSDDDGATFSNSLTISPTIPNGTSDEPQVTISGSDALVVWEDSADGNNDILFSKGTQIITVSVGLDEPTYKLGDTATVTITDSTESGNGSITASVISSTGDTSGFNFNLAETGTLGTFSSSITFSETLNSDSSSNRLKANPGDTITVDYSSLQATSTIFPRTIEFLLEDNGQPFTGFDYGDIVNLLVTDKNSNINPGVTDTVTVNVTSTRDTTGILLVLTENGTDTNFFGGSSSRLVFMDGQDFPTTSSTITVTSIDNFAENSDINQIDSMEVLVNSTTSKKTSPGGISLTLFETGINTSDFARADLTLSSSTTIDNSTIKVSPEDILSVTFTDLTANALVSPFPNSHGGISVDFPDGDTVSATLGIIKQDVTVDDLLAGGGGGGGLVRPGLVVNVLAGAVGGGGGGPPGPTITLRALSLSDSGSEIISMPPEIREIAENHDPYTPLEPMTDVYEEFDFPLSLNGKGFVLGDYENTLQTVSVNRGEPVEFVLVFYTTSEVAHTSLNFNLGPTRLIAGSDTQVLLYKDKFEIVDPNGNIASATGSLNNDDDLKRVATFSIVFSDDIQWTNSDLVVRSWNDALNSGDIIIYDAIEIQPSEEEIAFEESIPEPEVETLKSQYIPIWIKNNAAWWSQQLIEDSDFVAGIEYLIQNEIITIQDDQVIAPSYSSNDIPVWIKSNAGWWSEDLITEKEFIDGLQWLISNGIIQVKET